MTSPDTQTAAAADVVLCDGLAPICTVTLNRPAVLNAVNGEVIRRLDEIFTNLAARSDVRVVIVRGAGEKAFAAGADLAAMVDMDAAATKVFTSAFHRMAARVAALHAPVVCAAHGFVLGGGLEVALLCDFIIAADNAQFGFPENSVGVIPGFGGTQRLPRRIGGARARQLLYTGARIKAEQALAWGLVNEVVPVAELEARVLAIAGAITKGAPRAVAAAKQVVGEGEDLPFEQAVSREQHHFGLLFETEDQKEGMRAFLDKRPPRFAGK